MKAFLTWNFSAPFFEKIPSYGTQNAAEKRPLLNWFQEGQTVENPIIINLNEKHNLAYLTDPLYGLLSNSNFQVVISIRKLEVYYVIICMCDYNQTELKGAQIKRMFLFSSLPFSSFVFDIHTRT